ncbi:dimethyl sulfoxide reductase anchor subunit family protein [Wenxinia saemankumensis]|uniref:DMSO reductase anchor subunit n=1 Tax=Wenxinia saemankumensis TaxID=1447782 RepID=A0A1M6E5M0_9RHOB|nr:DmsC/YnfH family molybdoenzyme membrane anchor subunit [Wenxinia saemankumensis]SHI80568.1 DMSO reductase anchor subunit [Wenxinia saemankumensis]
MNPAPSIIAFTTLSGAGFGLLVFLGLGLPAPTGWAGFAWFALAYALAAGGLVSSVFHLGHPERAPLALTQWRTSWLSREGIAAIATLAVLAIYAAGLVFLDLWLWPLGILGAAGAAATLACTAMIYTQMRTVPRWRHWSTPALFGAHALAGGAILAGLPPAALPLLAIGAALQAYVFLDGDRRFARSGTDMNTATRLPGRVRQFEPPHTGPNYLLDEMVYVVARRRAAQLRLLCLALGFALPILVLLLSWHPAALALAALSHLAGVAAGRWLFFAEAEHVVGLYYGRRVGTPGTELMRPRMGSQTGPSS